MSDPNIHASHAFLKDLKSKTHQLLHFIDQLDMLTFELKQLYQDLQKVCREESEKE